MEESNIEHYLSWSGGADSTATALLAIQRGEPLTAIVYCEVMFDAEISGEVPEHAEFIHKIAIPWFEKRGVNVIVLRSKKTFTDYFYWPITKGKNAGKLHGFPLSSKGRCSIKRDCKLPPLKNFIRSHPGAIWYLGIAHDEKKRLLSIPQNSRSLLDKYKVTQADAREMCKQNGILSPIYDFAPRGGCFFCPNAKSEELRHLRDFHPELWNRLVNMQKDTRTVRENSFGFNLSLTDFENNFDFDDRQITWEDLGL